MRIDRSSWAAAAFFALLPPAAGAGGLAVAPMVALAGLASAHPRTLLEAARRRRLFLTALLAFVAWTILSALWSPYPDHAQAYRLGGVVGTGLLFVVGLGQSQRWVRAGGLAAALVLAFLMVIEARFNMPLNRLVQPDTLAWVLARNPGRGVTILVVIVWGALAGLIALGGRWRAPLTALLAVTTGWVSMQFGMQANAVAFALGLCAFAAGIAAPRIAVLTVSGLVGLWLLLAPFLVPVLVQDPRFVAKLPETWAIRAEIWKFASARIIEQPLFGRGLDASRAFDDTIVVRGHSMNVMQLHPHSASLQIWLETGAVGTLLATAALALGARELSRAAAQDRVLAAAACGTIAAVGLIANVSFGAWQEWWIATAFAGAALAAAASVRRRV